MYAEGERALIVKHAVRCSNNLTPCLTDTMGWLPTRKMCCCFCCMTRSLLTRYNDSKNAFGLNPFALVPPSRVDDRRERYFAEPDKRDYRGDERISE